MWLIQRHCITELVILNIRLIHLFFLLDYFSDPLLIGFSTMQISVNETQWQGLLAGRQEVKYLWKVAHNDEFVSFNSTALGSYSFRKLRRVMGLCQTGGFESIFQDKCKYTKWNILYYLHETVSERTSWWVYCFGWCKGWNLKWNWENRTWLKYISYREFP